MLYVTVQIAVITLQMYFQKVGEIHVAVSYTHLDVYKRQIIMRAQQNSAYGTWPLISRSRVDFRAHHKIIPQINLACENE